MCAHMLTGSALLPHHVLHHLADNPLLVCLSAPGISEFTHYLGEVLLELSELLHHIRLCDLHDSHMRVQVTGIPSNNVGLECLAFDIIEQIRAASQEFGMRELPYLVLSECPMTPW